MSLADLFQNSNSPGQSPKQATFASEYVQKQTFQPNFLQPQACLVCIAEPHTTAAAGDIDLRSDTMVVRTSGPCKQIANVPIVHTTFRTLLLSTPNTPYLPILYCVLCIGSQRYCADNKLEVLWRGFLLSFECLGTRDNQEAQAGTVLRLDSQINNTKPPHTVSDDALTQLVHDI